MIDRAQDEYLERLNKNAKEMPYKVGDWVLVRIQDRSTYISRKWSAKYQEPYQVTAIIGPGVVKVKDTATDVEQIIHIVYLRPYNQSKSPPPLIDLPEEEDDIQGTISVDVPMDPFKDSGINSENQAKTDSKPTKTENSEKDDSSIPDELDPELLKELYEAEARFEDYGTDPEMTEDESDDSSITSQDDTSIFQRVKQAGNLLLGKLLPKKQVPLTPYTGKTQKQSTVPKRPQQQDKESAEDDSPTSEEDSIDSTDDDPESSDLSKKGGGKGERRSSRLKGKAQPTYKETRLESMKEVRTRREKGSAIKQSRGKTQAQRKKR